MQMRILIVEDEIILAQRVQRLTAEILSHLSLQFQIVQSLREAEQFLQSNTIDLLFLDLNLDGKSGFELLKTDKINTIPTVIISAYKEYAIEAFDFGVVDFVRKPVTPERLEKALTRVLNIKSESPSDPQFLDLKKGSSIQPVPLTDIKYIQGAGVYSRVCLTSNEKILYNKSLDKLEDLLPATFFRIHKSFIIQLSILKEIHISAGSRYNAEMVTGEMIPIGRTFYKALKARLFKER
jgi:two-component system response regulator LytT